MAHKKRAPAANRRPLELIESFPASIHSFSTPSPLVVQRLRERFGFSIHVAQLVVELAGLNPEARLG